MFVFPLNDDLNSLVRDLLIVTLIGFTISVVF